MATTTTAISPSSPIRTAVHGELQSLRQRGLLARAANDAAHTPDQTAPAGTVASLSELANELRTSPTRLYRLILTGYLVLVQNAKHDADVLVQRPPEKAMQWLRGIFAPLYLRPILELRQAAVMMGVEVRDLKAIAIDYGIQLYVDEGFGEVISVVDFHRLHRALVRERRPARFDRQSLMGVLALIRGISIPTSEKGYNLPYHERLELEIKRICRLNEPERTARACAFYEAYMDAKTMNDCLEKYHAATHPVPGKERKLDEHTERMVTRIVGQEVLVEGRPGNSENSTMVAERLQEEEI